VLLELALDDEEEPVLFLKIRGRTVTPNGHKSVLKIASACALGTQSRIPTKLGGLDASEPYGMTLKHE